MGKDICLTSYFPNTMRKKKINTFISMAGWWIEFYSDDIAGDIKLSNAVNTAFIRWKCFLQKRKSESNDSSGLLS